jgi:gag-polypeptide of LTR copia-type
MDHKLESIPKLHEKNYSSWIIDIRAYLRQKKLWQSTQEPLEADPKSKAVEQHQEAADFLTLTITPTIKRKLAEPDFNDGYLMLKKLQSLLSPVTEFNFFRSCQELFSLRQGNSVDEFLTQVKTLNEQIDATKIELTTEKRTLLALMMGLSDEYRSLVQIWSATPSITVEKAIEMVREEAIRIEKPDFEVVKALSARGRISQLECWHCKRKGHKEENCWEKYPEKRPEPTTQRVIHPEMRPITAHVATEGAW